MLSISVCLRLNPFGTGQCLSTPLTKLVCEWFVSIPLEQGNVFRLVTPTIKTRLLIGLNPFGTGQCLSTELS